MGYTKVEPSRSDVLGAGCAGWINGFRTAAECDLKAFVSVNGQGAALGHVKI